MVALLGQAVQSPLAARRCPSYGGDILAKAYQVTFGVRFVNRVMQTLLRLGLAPKGTYLLTVPGRKSGKLYSTPVRLASRGW